MSWSCSDDEIKGNDVPDAEKAGRTYMEITLNTPASSRSGTDEEGEGTGGNDQTPSDEDTGGTPDYEVGNDNENAVRSVLVVAVGMEDNAEKVLFAKNTTDITTSGTSKAVQVDNVTLDTHKDKKYQIYVFANPTDGLTKQFTQYAKDKTPWTDVQDEVVQLGNEAYLDKDNLKKNGFLMSNAETAPEADFDRNGEDYILTAEIDIERAVARFDYKINGANFYFPIIDTENPDGNENKPSSTKNVVTKLGVHLTSYAFMNISKEFYALRRTADGYKNEGGALALDNKVIGGREISTNYVVDTDWKEKIGVPAHFNSANHFFVPFTDDTRVENLSYTALPVEADDLWNTTEGAKGNYGFMRYCSENTILGKDNQYRAYTTAIVFKGELYGKDLTDNNNPTTIYIREDSNNDGKDEVYYSLKELNEALGKDGLSVLGSDPSDEALAAVGVRKLSKDKEDKFSVYYTYWNRHNDNGDNNVMGPMEFAVVRNNVYKLEITSIKKLGHDTDKPIIPDEDPKAYFTLDVKVLPWTVRVNEIEF